MNYDRERAMLEQDATQDMILMRQPVERIGIAAYIEALETSRAELTRLREEIRALTLERNKMREGLEAMEERLEVGSEKSAQEFRDCLAKVRSALGAGQ